MLFVVLEKTLKSPLDCKIKPINPKGNQSWMPIGRTDAEAETPILWLPDAKRWFVKKDPDAGKDWRQEEKGMAENKMVGWNHWFNRHEFEQALGNGGGQESLVCCSPWGHKGLDTTEQLDNNRLNEEKPPTCIAHMWGICREMLQLVSWHLFIQNLLRAYYVPKVLLSGTHKEWDRDLYMRVWELPMDLWGFCSPRDPHWDMGGAQHLSSPQNLSAMQSLPWSHHRSATVNLPVFSTFLLVWR